MTATIEIAAGRTSRPSWSEFFARMPGVSVKTADGGIVADLAGPVADGWYTIERDGDYCSVYAYAEGGPTASRAEDDAPKRRRTALVHGATAVGTIGVELSPIGSEEFAREVAAALSDALDGLAFSDDAVFGDVRWLDGNELRESIAARRR